MQAEWPKPAGIGHSAGRVILCDQPQQSVRGSELKSISKTRCTQASFCFEARLLCQAPVKKSAAKKQITNGLLQQAGSKGKRGKHGSTYKLCTSQQAVLQQEEDRAGGGCKQNWTEKADYKEISEGHQQYPDFKPRNGTYKA